ncbi:MAG: alpha-glucosidase [Spirochaetales bacterium]|nr:alpha-glucosidase [Spirochaetales bacterium]
MDTKTVWWKQASFYQVYPRSFFDGTGDGLGDLPGLIAKLPYIRDTGFDAVWVSPFFKSPQADFGYDIADYFSAAPEYGTDEDILHLIDQAHRHSLKIIFDLVLNHTSDRHPWFIESRSSLDNPKRDWYVWRDGRKPMGRKPPNNWRSRLGKRGWQYDETTDQWYWAAFLDFQPDLNWRNPRVREAMFSVIRHWLQAGVDGFRLDIIGSIFEDADFRDNPFSPHLLPAEDRGGMFFQSSDRTDNLPETVAFAKDLRALVDEYTDPPRFLVGEAFGTAGTVKAYCGERENDGLNTVFLFETLQTPFTAPAFRKLTERFEALFPEPFTPVWVFGNHDRMRVLTALGGHRDKMKLLAAFQLTVRGIPFTYQGEEIGMTQLETDQRRCQDPVSFPYRRLPPFLFRLIMKITGGAICRDGCRSPMQWTAETNSGFCPPEVQPWLPVCPDFREVNVETEARESDSVYGCYRRFLDLRHRFEELRTAPMELLPPGDTAAEVLGYRRGGVTVLLNFSPQGRPGRPAPFAGSTICVSTRAGREGKPFDGLGPWEGVVLR